MEDVTHSCDVLWYDAYTSPPSPMLLDVAVLQVCRCGHFPDAVVASSGESSLNHCQRLPWKTADGTSLVEGKSSPGAMDGCEHRRDDAGVEGQGDAGAI